MPTDFNFVPTDDDNAFTVSTESVVLHIQAKDHKAFARLLREIFEDEGTLAHEILERGLKDKTPQGVRVKDALDAAIEAQQRDQ